MNLEQAINTALDYERKVRDTYRDALKKMKDDTGRKVFQVLADEEQGHVDYLESRLREWTKTGKLTPEKLATAIPSPEQIAAGVKQLKQPLKRIDHSAELELLKKALEVELTAGNFYGQMAKEMDGDGQKMFARFLEIEQGHRTIVQAQIDAVSGLGYWFDFQEFNLEAG
jgi:rubrerythrin